MEFNSSFINRYPLSKTLRFSLIPVGNTEANFEKKLLLQEDEKRAADYVLVKSYIDRYHKAYIESVLSRLVLNGINDYAALYYKNNKTEQEINSLEKLEDALRKQISKSLKSDNRYKFIFKKEMIQTLLPDFLSDSEEKERVASFANFTTYFTGFHTNRENIYSDEAKSTAVAFRCINENLPKFLDNVSVFQLVINALSVADINELKNNFSGLLGCSLEDMFTPDYFSFVLSQSGIERYNDVIGGYTCSTGEKIKGLNEYINLYNQQLGKGEKKLPLLKRLFKQILSDTESISFVLEKFNDDNEVLSSINKFYTEKFEDKSLIEILNDTKALFAHFQDFDKSGVFITNGSPITDISNSVFGSWDVISNAWKREYEEKTPLKNSAKAEAYYEKQSKAYKAIKSFSLDELERLGNSNEDVNGDISLCFAESVSTAVDDVFEKYNKAENLLVNPYENEKRLFKNDDAIVLIKDFLDSLKNLERIIKPLRGTGKGEAKDETFYGEFTAYYERIAQVDKLYDKVRNYMTQKPYSKDKIKLNFENPQLLSGWDRNKERDYRTVLLRKGRKYYLAIMDKTNNKIFADLPEVSCDEECYEKIDYKLLPGPNKMLPKVFFAASNIDYFAPSDHILKIREKETFKKGENFNINDCREFIDFFKESIKKHDEWSNYGFVFKDTSEYNDIGEFYKDVKNQGYSINFRQVSEVYINSCIDSGALYLFQIYNKDFSPYSKGTKNLHTLYFEMLFDERNLKDVVYQLNGGAEMFYRKASIKEKDKIVHPANTPIKNKNPDKIKEESVFEYDIIKDKRFTKRQFSLHIPITLNFKGDGGSTNLNADVRKSLRNADENYVIGIDRGERNLLYITVINSKGEIVEQVSGNEIISGNHKVDYHKLLDNKEKERLVARQNWTSVENIKELKEGYLSVIIHNICELVKKYNAVIAMEDLSSGFKNSRVKVEKQVYQKFEKMLTEKLNYLADKNLDVECEGGLLKAYQFTNSTKDYKRVAAQDGILFYVPAWLTSKIDPVTGFVDLLKPKYTSVSEAKTMFAAFDSIEYIAEEDLFSFTFDYSKFPRCSTSYRTKWTIYSNGERIYTFRDKNNNNEYVNKTVVLTDEFKALFNEYAINYSNDLKAQIVNQEKADFFKKLIWLLSLTMQMRNSITNSEVDYLISPVKDENGIFFDSRMNKESLPENADANGAYNIAKKALWAIEQIKNAPEDDIMKVKLSISNKDWLAYVQNEK